jgi:hypothetical protein
MLMLVESVLTLLWILPIWLTAKLDSGQRCATLDAVAAEFAIAMIVDFLV